MKDEQIKEMLNGIINNGEKWECRPDYKKCLYGTKNNPWQPYRLGDEIYNDWEYRKIELLDKLNLQNQRLNELKNENAELQKKYDELNDFSNSELKKCLMKIQELKKFVKSCLDEESIYTNADIEKLLEL